MTPKERQSRAWQDNPEPPDSLDDHLEDDYDARQGEGRDFNPIEQGMWDDDLDPYSGTYSEE